MITEAYGGLLANWKIYLRHALYVGQGKKLCQTYKYICTALSSSAYPEKVSVHKTVSVLIHHGQ